METVLSENRRIIAIGDIHGCISTLRTLMASINPQKEDQLVFLGDLIDRGDFSKQVIDYLIELNEACSCHFIMGNHEWLVLDYLENREPMKWFINGGQATLASYGIRDISEMPQEHLDFIRSFRYFIETPNYFFTHGGLDPELSVRDNMRYYKPEELCWQRVHMRKTFIESRNFKWEKTLVCAHTPVAEPIVQERLIAIDTGCVYIENPLLGKLTAVILPEREIIQTENCEE
ncbi:MAG: serine/threonine protein phosphatase [Chlorobiaceae bacterium]|nr:serine/threonine protein phosphatase [Chlorobiaceae bacterium]